METGKTLNLALQEVFIMPETQILRINGGRLTCQEMTITSSLPCPSRKEVMDKTLQLLELSDSYIIKMAGNGTLEVNTSLLVNSHQTQRTKFISLISIHQLSPTKLRFILTSPMPPLDGTQEDSISGLPRSERVKV